MQPSTRYGLVGIGALALLSLVHWGRRSHFDGPEPLLYLMGVLPNVAAAIAIPFVVLSIWADQKPHATYPEARRAFALITLGAGLALVAWEFIQQSSRTLVFDTNDIVATFVGLGAAWLLFAVVNRRVRPAKAREIP